MPLATRVCDIAIPRLGHPGRPHLVSVCYHVEPLGVSPVSLLLCVPARGKTRDLTAWLYRHHERHLEHGRLVDLLLDACDLDWRETIEACRDDAELAEYEDDRRGGKRDAR